MIHPHQVAKKHMCTTCGKGYSYKHLLNEHTWKEHGEGQHIRLVGCSTIDPSTVAIIIPSTVAIIIPFRFPCNWEGCDYTAKYKQTLHTHVMERHHGVKRKHRQEVSWEIKKPQCLMSFLRMHTSKLSARPATRD